MAANPYNWQSHRPQIQIPRPDVEFVVETLSDNGSAVVLGGRGMGKSVFLRQLKARLELTPDTRVLMIVGPPAALTVEACLAHLAQVLGVPVRESFYSLEIFESYFARDDAPERLRRRAHFALDERHSDSPLKNGGGNHPIARVSRC